jgi:phosphatidylserine decarboxylase
MTIDRAGLPFIAAALVPALGLVAAGQEVWAWPWVGLAAGMAYFFRDPDRHVPAASDLVVSPADGRVMVAGPAEPDAAPPGDWLQVTVFLSPLDVHINRAPIESRVVRIDYRPGRFLPAYRAESRFNERTELWLDHAGTSVVVRQVVGVLARRIVCRAREGERLATGQRFGLMKFGSRMDVFLPPTADLRVDVGARVRGGETVIAALRPRGTATSREAVEERC